MPATGQSNDGGDGEMVVLRERVIERELERRGWDVLRMASEAQVSHQTIRNALDRKSLSTRTQMAIWDALGRAVPFGKLFEMRPDLGEPAEAEETAPGGTPVLREGAVA
jgi:hypothetical protein